jgi:hypothetical protein
MNYIFSKHQAAQNEEHNEQEGQAVDVLVCMMMIEEKRDGEERSLWFVVVV